MKTPWREGELGKSHGIGVIPLKFFYFNPLPFGKFYET
jgi:hypothetical protein